MKLNIRKTLSMVLCLAMVLVSVVPIFGKTITQTEVIYTSKETYYLPLWHYSGSYWIIGSGVEKEKVTDKEIFKLGGIEQYLNDNYTSAAFSIPIPSIVKQALTEGATVNIGFGSRGNADWKTIFNPDSLYITSDLSADTGTFDFTLQPIFRLVRNKNYTDFVPSLTESIPLIHYRYGSNIYSIFGNGKTAVQADGYFDEGAANNVFSPYIHPSVIKNTKGELKPGYPVTIGGNIVASDGYRVGDGTFANAGAVGIMFCFPINVIFEKVTTTWVDDPVAPKTEDNTGNGENPANNDNNDNTGGDTSGENGGDPANTPDVPALPSSVNAILNLPSETYEGRAIAATDVSRLEIGGSKYNVIDALSEGLATHTFEAPGAKQGKASITDLELSYDNAGTYPVTLRVETTDGESDSDSKCVKVLPCPSVGVILSGSQKQNRKQTLDIRVQQNPAYPIKKLIITVTELSTGEIITVHRNFDGAQTPPVNADHIKYRTLYDTDPDKYCVACRLDFLSKFGEDKVFRYTVTATDSRGRSDTKTADFTVIKDTPPEAAIAIDDIYYRSKGSDTAVITVSDASKGSGNYQRSWTCDGTNLRDLAYGTQKSIAFDRTGVGPFSVSLTVKDLWTEETLEEYVTDADHLSATATATSVVGNIAPTVSFDMSKTRTAELLLLARDDSTEAAIRSALPSLRTRLAAKGIDAKITIERQRSAGIKTSGTISRIGTIRRNIEPLGTASMLNSTQTYSAFWTSGHVTASGGHIYSMDSDNLCIAFPNAMYKSLKRTYPYTITAYDDNLKTLWNFNVSESLFPSPTDFCSATLAHDEQELYLYLVSDGRTLMLSKSDGTLHRIADCELGLENYVAGDAIYTIKDDGIYRLGTDGTLKQLSAMSIATGQNKTRLVNGELCFIAADGTGLSYCRFNPESENLRKTSLGVTNSSAVLAIDTRGYAVIQTAPGTFKVFGPDGKALGSGTISKRCKTAVPCFDASGRINYVCGSYRERILFFDEWTSYNRVAICSLFTSYSDANTLAKDGDECRTDGEVAYAFESEDDVVSMVLPSHAYSLDDSTYDSMTQFNFFTRTGEKTCGILVSTGLPVTHFSGWSEGGILIPDYNTSVNAYAMPMRHQESEADELARLKTKWLCGDRDISLCLSFAGDFSADELISQLEGSFSQPEPPVKTYAKGQKISYKAYYSDWENDPSKASYWLYTHEPGTDGLWERSGKILSSPVTSFEKNGKYTLTHWQTDDAGRGLTSAYDKDSAPCTMIFYITDGDKAGKDDGPKDSKDSRPPVVETISTSPETIYVGDEYTISAVVSDPDGDTLDVTIELYRKGVSDPVKTYTKKGVKPAGGTYPPVTMEGIPKAEPGTYEVAVTASDGKSIGVGSYAFTPKIKASLSASVYHTDAWDSNRQNFNVKYFSKTYGEDVSDYAAYCKAKSPRIRGKNVFWPGEELQLAATLKGNVTSVKAAMLGFDYKSTLTASGKPSSDGSQRFTGTMYDKTMKTALSKDNPRQVTVRFTATYSDGTVLTFDVPVIFDQDIGYWMLHRTK